MKPDAQRAVSEDAASLAKGDGLSPRAGCGNTARAQCKGGGTTNIRNPQGENRHTLPCLILVVALLVGGIILCLTGAGTGVIAEVCCAAMMLGVVSSGAAAGRIEVGMERDAVGRPRAYKLSVGDEVAILYPGVSWSLVDRFKWTARGLIEEPHLFHVHSDGTVEINWEKVKVSDPGGQEKLQQQIDKRHGSTVSQEHLHAAGTAGWSAPAQAVDDKTRFKVKLDRFGHIFIECIQGLEREETGLRGIATLIHKGMMVKPRDMRVDPLQRAVEIDGVRYECNEDGAKRLEEALNERYTPNAANDKKIAIHIRESLTSSTGYDIQFVTVRAGMPFEVKGHLTQEILDILSDTSRCTLLEPGTQLRIAAPFLLIRRRRADMGEEKIPGIPDVNYLRTNAAQMEQILNHPHIRRGGGVAAQVAPRVADEAPPEVTQIRVVRNAANERLCWFECVMSDGTAQPPRAITHHNITELQHTGIFRPDLDVLLSLDNSVLSVLDKATRQGQSVSLNAFTSAEEMLLAGQLLTNALKPVAPREKPAPAAVPPAPAETKSGPIKVALPGTPATPSPSAESQPPPAAVGTPDIDPAIKNAFSETDPVKINLEIFAKLPTRFGLPVQDAYFSLPMVFNDRRFEIINFEGGEITSIMELRDEWFYGFYLSHNSEKKVLLVYACNGTHIEWGPDRCVVQQSIRSEPEEYNTSGLLGFAQDKEDQFVFIVTVGFKEWIKTREKHCAEVTVFFHTVKEMAAAPDDYKWVWPERPAA